MKVVFTMLVYLIEAIILVIPILAQSHSYPWLEEYDPYEAIVRL